VGSVPIDWQRQTAPVSARTRPGNTAGRHRSGERGCSRAFDYTENGKILTTFRDLGVLPEICDALERGGITTPFAIQEMTLSVALMGTDLIGQARTGTGKTLAFGIPVLQRAVAPHDPDYEELVAPGKPQALIVAPTRELALQVSSDLQLAGKDRGIRVLTVYGGVPYEPQLEALQSGVEVVVGTPGRLIDLMNRRALDISHVKSLVLDEADEMLDLGFLPDVERLLAKTPETRQTMLFSATMPSAIVALARTHMRHPMNIRAESSYDNQTVPATAQFIYQAHDLDKPEMIGRILQAEGSGLTIIFTRTKRQSQRIADELTERGFDASPLHGDMAQTAREKALAKFRDGKLRVLVATDVAARGIDVTGVTHVINYTCPEDEKTYIHRIGRTGRAGATGIAVTFVDWADLARWKMINKALDLPFEDPPETYSSSEHFFHDMGIAPGTKGRLIPEGQIVIPRQPRTDDRKGGGGRGGRSEGGRDGGSRNSGGRPRTSGRTEAPAAVAPVADADKPARAPRNRNRRRTRGGDGSGTGAGQQAAAE
jgi:superfamily II DNA/RNA helicase